MKIYKTNKRLCAFSKYRRMRLMKWLAVTRMVQVPLPHSHHTIQNMHLELMNTYVSSTQSAGKQLEHSF